MIVEVLTIKQPEFRFGFADGSCTIYFGQIYCFFAIDSLLLLIFYDIAGRK